MNRVRDARPPWPALAQAAAILAGAWFALSPALRGEFLWDDIDEQAENATLHGWGGLGRIWFSPQNRDYYPLKSSVQWLEWHLWGDSSLGNHAVNLGLHALSALLLWRLLARIGLKAGWIGGLLFAVHPLCVESVAWMAELKNTLALPPLLMGFAAYFEWDRAVAETARFSPSLRNAGAFRYGTSLFWFLVAMLGKTSGVMFPVVLLLYAWWKRGRVGRRDIQASLPFFGISAVLGGITVWLQEHRSMAAAVIPLGGWAARAARAGVISVFYFSKAVFPARLLPMYPHWSVRAAGLAPILPALSIASALAWCWTRRAREGRHLLFGTGFFLINLLPVLGFIPISHMRFSWAMDHLLYVPLLGVIGLASAGVDVMRDRRGPAAAWALAAILAAALAAGSRDYARMFRRSIDLWSYATERNPEAWLGHYNLGVARQAAGDRRGAAAEYARAIRINPGYAEAHLNYGNVLQEEGQRAEAIGQYREALRWRKDYPEAESNLCLVLLGAGQAAEAMRHGERAVALKPDFAEARNNLGTALLRVGRLDPAMAQFREALRLKPGYAEAANGLGIALAYSGRLAEAEDEFRTALRLKPGFAEASDNLRRVVARRHAHE